MVHMSQFSIFFLCPVPNMKSAGILILVLMTSVCASPISRNDRELLSSKQINSHFNVTFILFALEVLVWFFHCLFFADIWLKYCRYGVACTVCRHVASFLREVLYLKIWKEGGGGDKNMKESQNLTPIDIFLCMNVPYTYRDILVLPF